MDTAQTEQAVIQAKAEADLNQDIDNHKKLYALDPTAWWANHGTSSKIGAILSMVGAGLSGRDPSQILDKMISQDTAELSRREGMLDRLGASQQAVSKLKMQGSREKLTNLQARHIAALGIVDQQLEARIASTGDLRAKSNYEALRGQLKERMAKLESGEIATRTQEANMAGSRRLAYDSLGVNARLKEEGIAAKEAAAGHTGGAAPLPGFEGPGTFKGILGKVTPYLAARQDGIEGLQRVRNILGDNKKGWQNNAVDLQKIQVLEANLHPIFRLTTGSGANITGPEIENINKLKGDWAGYLLGKVTGLELSQQLKITQQMLAHSAVNFVNEATPDGKVNVAAPGSVWDNVFKEEGADQEAPKHYEENVKNILTSGGSQKKIMDELQDALDHGNWYAGDALDKMKAKNMVPQTGYVYN